MKRTWIGILLGGLIALAQAPSESLQRAASVKQLMLDLIHPASNDLLLLAYRGGPRNETDWATVRRNSLSLAESGNLLMLRGRALDEGDWLKDSRLLADAGAAAYKSALAKDEKALAVAVEQLDASCTTCHKQYRPNVFPKGGGSK